MFGVHQMWLRVIGALLVLLLAACSSQRQSSPSAPRPVIKAPTAPSITQASHPRYAPPPGVAAYWDNRLGVYVLKGQAIYYRQRLFYRYAGQWQCASHPNGPWEHIAITNVPPGLRQR